MIEQMMRSLHPALCQKPEARTTALQNEFVSPDFAKRPAKPDYAFAAWYRLPRLIPARRPRAVPYASHSTIPKKVTVLRPLTYFRGVPLTVLYTSTPLPSSEGSA